MDDQTAYAEVLYFFQVHVNAREHSLATVSIYSDPDQDLLDRSLATVWSCRAGGREGLRVIDVKMIRSVVAMIPQPRSPGHEHYQGRYFVVEKLGVLSANGSEEGESNEDDDVDYDDD